MKIAFISDTHTKHKQLVMPECDMVIFSGDSCSKGFEYELLDFLKWFDKIPATHKIMIAGNHDIVLELDSLEPNLITLFNKHVNSSIIYLEDEEVVIDGIKIYGSPWQPEFYNWAFNLPRGGKELKDKWSKIPEDTDILVTHGPPNTFLDTSGAPWNVPLLGCELLLERVLTVKPKIHCFGHIHGSYGTRSNEYTEFINAAMLDERYNLVHKPILVDFNTTTKEIIYLDF